jgi:hypothetical protein
MTLSSELRLTHRKMNEVIVRNLSVVDATHRDDLLNSFHGANYFTTISTAFYQIGLKKDSIELTAFITQTDGRCMN